MSDAWDKPELCGSDFGGFKNLPVLAPVGSTQKKAEDAAAAAAAAAAKKVPARKKTVFRPVRSAECDKYSTRNTCMPLHGYTGCLWENGDEEGTTRGCYLRLNS
uniref:Uncharacterized protein n=1 Tax=Eutreptiella gymnastica TaxID=73025 RepID=A0A7S1IVH5_9EUGL